MADPHRTKYLRVALLLVGLIFIIGSTRSLSSGRPAGRSTLAVTPITSK